MPSAQLIKPKGSVFKPEQQRRITQNTMTALAKGVKVDFDVTTQTWEHRPTFHITEPSPTERTVETSDAVYAMLDAGTRPHLIRPRRARILRFQSPFRAKTVPNQILSRAGSTGGTEVWARAVNHPGTKPRNWAKVIAAKWQKQAPAIVQRAIATELR